MKLKYLLITLLSITPLTSLALQCPNPETVGPGSVVLKSSFGTMRLLGSGVNTSYNIEGFGHAMIIGGRQLICSYRVSASGGFETRDFYIMDNFKPSRGTWKNQTTCLGPYASSCEFVKS